MAAEQEARKQAAEEALELLERVPAEEAPEDDTEPEAETPETEPDSELAAYRRAALTEQNAAARARRLQAHVSALCDNARSRYQDTGEEISALSVDLATGIERLQDALAELQLIFDQSEDAFEALELPDEDACAPSADFSSIFLIFRAFLPLFRRSTCNFSQNLICY